MHADYISQQHKGIQLRFLYIKRAFIMTTGCFNVDMHVLSVESSVYALWMNILSDLISELQQQAHANHTNLKMQKTLFPFCQEDAFFAKQLHVMENSDMHARDKA